MSRGFHTYTVEDAGDVVVRHARLDFTAFLLRFAFEQVAEDELRLVLVGVAFDDVQATMQVTHQRAFGFGAGADCDHDRLFESASVGDFQRLIELVPCGVRLGEAVLLQFAADLGDLLLHVLQLAHDHRERGLRLQMLQVGQQFGHRHGFLEAHFLHEASMLTFEIRQEPSHLVPVEEDLSLVEQLLIVFRDVRDPLLLAARHAGHDFGEGGKHGPHPRPFLERVPDLSVVLGGEVDATRAHRLGAWIPAFDFELQLRGGFVDGLRADGPHRVVADISAIGSYARLGCDVRAAFGALDHGHDAFLP